MSRTGLIIVVIFSVLLLPHFCPAQEKSRYVTLSYSGSEVLRDFNKRLVLNRKLRYKLREKRMITVEDEVIAKLEVLIEKAESILNMFPPSLHITVRLLPTRREVAAVYQQKYGRRADHIAYYSLKEDTIYISVRDTKLRVVAHEIGHAVVDHYFKVRPPYNIHELMAQFTEKHITD